MTKTNAMRILDSKKIAYKTLTYEVSLEDLSGVHVAETIGKAPDEVFKTLVLVGDKTGYLVCCIPVAEKIDLKKIAKISDNKKVEMLPMKDLLPITGYVRGGCSPIGMKKKFPTYIEESALLFDEISISAGMRGAQMIINPTILIDAVEGIVADII